MEILNSFSTRVFNAHFGVCKQTTIVLWMHLCSLELDFAVEFHHFLWTLYFLKVYNTLDVSATHWKVDVKTFNLWIWRVIALLAFTLDTVILIHKYLTYCR